MLPIGHVTIGNERASHWILICTIRKNTKISWTTGFPDQYAFEIPCFPYPTCTSQPEQYSLQRPVCENGGLHVEAVRPQSRGSCMRLYISLVHSCCSKHDSLHIKVTRCFTHWLDDNNTKKAGGYPAMGMCVKGEVQSRITMNLKRKHKNVPYMIECKQWWKMGKHKEVMTFWNFSHFFRKHFLTSPYEYSNERVDDVMPSQFASICRLPYEILKFFLDF